MVSEGEKEKARRGEGRGGNNNKEALSKKSPRAPRGGAQEIGRQMEMEREGRDGQDTNAPRDGSVCELQNDWNRVIRWREWRGKRSSHEKVEAHIFTFEKENLRNTCTYIG